MAKEAAHGFRVPLYGYRISDAFELAVTAMKTKDEQFVNVRIPREQDRP